MSLKIAKLFILFSLMLTPLAAEIMTLEVRFNPVICNMQCPSMLEKAFKNMTSVADVTMNGEQGFALLRWKPNMPFDFWAFKRAMQSVGANYQYLRIKVRGAIKGKDKNFALVSLGDNTQFNLLGPIQTHATQYSISRNLVNHPLTPYLIETLQQGVTENRVAVIQGWLFEPERNPPYYIVIEQMNYVVDQPQQQPQQKK